MELIVCGLWLLQIGMSLVSELILMLNLYIMQAEAMVFVYLWRFSGPGFCMEVWSNKFALTCWLFNEEFFPFSAVYHIVHWTPGWRQFMRQMDHANIFILIAGNYTPFSYNMLTGNWRTGILAAAWGVVRFFTCLGSVMRDAIRMINTVFLSLGCSWCVCFGI